MQLILIIVIIESHKLQDLDIPFRKYARSHSCHISLSYFYSYAASKRNWWQIQLKKRSRKDYVHACRSFKNQSLFCRINNFLYNNIILNIFAVFANCVWNLSSVEMTSEASFIIFLWQQLFSTLAGISFFLNTKCRESKEENNQCFHVFTVIYPLCWACMRFFCNRPLSKSASHADLHQEAAQNNQECHTAELLTKA